MVRGRKESLGIRDMEMAKQGYRDAKAKGDREEEARWANQIGHLHKNRGEYVEALKWFRLDYQVSLKHLPEKQLMPTCQSVGEMYLRLENFDHALVYQEKHLQFAQQAGDLVEQQRASTQLGRTYFDLYEKDDSNYAALEKAKLYLQMSLDLAHTLKDDPPDRDSPSFVKELVNAYNNMGLLKIFLEDYEKAEKILMDALNVCDEEEIGENDEGRTRIHHNLGRIYIETQEWEKAKEQFNIDIKICQIIPQPQGEACGLINLGLIYYKMQDYDRALSNYNRALEIACNLEDEDSLVQSIKLNISTAEEAQMIMNDITREEHTLRKLTRNLNAARGTASEMRCLVKLHECLKKLIELAINIEAWPKHLEFAKRNKNAVKELGDAEKLCDALLEVGEAYYNLRKFHKATKWYRKSWETSKSISNKEGQAVAKINLGNSLDSAGKLKEAIEAYKEGYKIAVLGELISSQLTALQNLHNSYLVRFGNHEEARKLENDIERLKRSLEERREEKDSSNERCPETDSEDDSCINLAANERDEDAVSLHPSCHLSEKSNLPQDVSDPSSQINIDPSFSDDVPLAMYLHSCKGSQKKKAQQVAKSKSKTDSFEQRFNNGVSGNCTGNINNIVKNNNSVKKLTGRKRARLVVSDDEKSDEGIEIDEGMEEGRKEVQQSFPENAIHLSDEDSADLIAISPSKSMSMNLCNDLQKEQASAGSEGDFQQYFPVLHEGSNDRIASQTNDGNAMQSGDLQNHEKKNKTEDFVGVHFGETIVMVDVKDSYDDAFRTVDWLITEAVQLVCFENYRAKKLSGTKPIVDQILCNATHYNSNQLMKDLLANIGSPGLAHAVIKGWIQLTLADWYLLFCREFNQVANPKLLKRLLGSKASQDIFIASDCELDDLSVLPLLKSLSELGEFSHLDFSHNALGNQTMHRIQEIIASSHKSNVGLTLDLHDNHLGAFALLQICECPVSVSRLEVLNLSKNHLTDACGRNLSTFIKKCKALAILNLEDCGLTGRTVKLIGELLPSDSGLVKLSIGKNNPIPGNAIAVLLRKLASLTSFAELDINNIELDKFAVERLCDLLHSSPSITSMAIGGTSIGMDGILKLCENLVNRPARITAFDFSFCGFGVNLFGAPKFSKEFLQLEGLVRLDLSGNALKEKGASVLVSLLPRAHHLKILIANACQLGQTGIVHIIQALPEDSMLQELYLAKNNFEDARSVFNISGLDGVYMDEGNTLKFSRDLPQLSSPAKSAVLNFPGTKECENGPAEDKLPSSSPQRPDISEYDVADSEDEDRQVDTDLLFSPCDCTSSSKTFGPSQTNSPMSPHFNLKTTQSKQNNFGALVPYSEVGTDLCAAIMMAKNLQLLDLSDNSLWPEMVEKLYTAWSSSRLLGIPSCHTGNHIIHFTLKHKQCCGQRLCCSK